MIQFSKKKMKKFDEVSTNKAIIIIQYEMQNFFFKRNVEICTQKYTIENIS